MNENERKLTDILLTFEKEGILSKVILIGSWCTFFYQYLFDSFNPGLRTVDVDFYVPDTKRFKTKTNLVKSLQDLNFDFVQDRLTHKSKFISPDGFELEFLTKLNRNQLSCVEMGDTNIYAESISYLEEFLTNYIQIDFNGLIVNVTSPSSYVLQKLLINKDRKGDYKKEKDLDSIRNVLKYIKASNKYYEELKNELNSYPKKWKKIIIETASDNGIEL